MITVIKGPKKQFSGLIFSIAIVAALGCFLKTHAMEEVHVADEKDVAAPRYLEKQIEADKALALKTAVVAVHEQERKRFCDSQSSASSLSTSPMNSNNDSSLFGSDGSLSSQSACTSSGSEDFESVADQSNSVSPAVMKSAAHVVSSEEAARIREIENAMRDGECTVCMDDYGADKDLTSIKADRYKWKKTAVRCVEKVKLQCGHIFCDVCVGNLLRAAGLEKEKERWLPTWLSDPQSLRPDFIICPVCRAQQPITKDGILVLPLCACCHDPLSTAYENATFFECDEVDGVFTNSPLAKIARGPKARVQWYHRFHEKCLHAWMNHADFKWAMRVEGLVMLCPCHPYEPATNLSTDRYGGYITIPRNSPLFEQFAKFMVDNPSVLDHSPRSEEEESRALALKQDFDEKYGDTPQVFQTVVSLFYRWWHRNSY